MAEDLGALSVTLSLNTDNFTKNMQSVERQLKTQDAAFQASVAEAGKLGNAVDKLSNRQQYLSMRLQTQQGAMEKYAQEITRLSGVHADLDKELQTLPAQIDAAKRAWQDSERALKEQEKAMDKDADATEALRKETAALRDEYDKLKNKQDAGKRSQDTVVAQLEKTQLAYQKMRKEVAQTGAELDKLKGPLGRAGDWMRATADQTIATGKQWQKAGQSISKAGSTLTRNVTLPIVGVLGTGVKAAIDFEDAFAGVRKTVEATPEEFAAIKQGMIDMSNRMPFAAKEIAAVGEAAGQLGVKAPDINHFSETMLKMGQATDLAATEGATSMARFAAITGMPIDNVDRLGSSIVALGNNYAASESEITEFGMRIAAAGRQVGYSEASTMAFATALRAVGVDAEAGGTAFSKVALNMDMAAAKGEKAMAKYAKVAGMSAKEFTKLWGEDAASATVKFIEGLGRVEKSGGNLALVLENLGYKEVRVRDTLMRAAGASHMVADAVTLANRAWHENTALQDEVNKRNETTAAKLKVLGNRAQNAFMQFGEAAMPALNKAMDLVGGLIDRFAAMDEKARSNLLFSAGAAALAGPLLKVLGETVENIGDLKRGYGEIKRFMGSGSPVATLIGSAAPWLAVAGGIGAVTMALIKYGETAEKREARLSAEIKGFSLKLDEAKIQGFVDSVAESKGTYTGYVDMVLETRQTYDTLWSNFETKLDNGLSKKELRDIKKDLGAQVNIELKDAEEAQAAMSDGEKKKSKGLMATLKDLEAEYVAVMTSIQKKGGEVTREQATQLENLETRITGVVEQLRSLTEDEKKLGESAVTLVKAGVTNEKTQADAVAFVLTEGDLRLQKAAEEGAKKDAEALEKYNKAVTEAAETGDVLKGEMAGQELANRLAANAADIAAEKTKTAQELSGLFDGIVKQYPEEVAKLQRVLDAYSLKKIIGEGGFAALSKEDIEKNREQLAQSLQDVLTINEQEKLFGDKIEALDPKVFTEKLFAGFQSGDFEDAVPDLFDTLPEMISDGLLESIKGMEGNPVLEVLKGMLDSGQIKPEDLDLTALSGALSTSLKAMGIKEIGGEIGKELPAGLGEGITAETAKATDAATQLASDTDGALRGGLGVESPSTKGKEAGKYYSEGVGLGITENKGLATTPSAQLGGAVISATSLAITTGKQSVVDALVGVVDAAITAAAVKLNAFLAELSSAEARADALETRGTTTNYNKFTINAKSNATARDIARESAKAQQKAGRYA